MHALVVRAGALGDVLLLRRTIAALCRGGYEVTLLAPGGSGAALVGPGPSEARRLLDWERADVAGLVTEGGALADTLKRDLEGFELALALTRNQTVARQLRTVVRRVLLRDPQPPADVHAAHWLARDVSGESDPVPPACRATAEEQERARDFARGLPERFLAVHPGSGSARKNWPGFVELLRERPWPGPSLVVCGPADAEAVAPLRCLAGVVLAEGLPLRVLGAVLGQAGVFVGNDSGVSHLAAAWGAPTVALFGPTDARTWAPDGEHVHTIQSPTAEMAGIGLAEVTLAAARVARRR